MSARPRPIYMEINQYKSAPHTPRENSHMISARLPYKRVPTYEPAQDIWGGTDSARIPMLRRIHRKYERLCTEWGRTKAGSRESIEHNIVDQIAAFEQYGGRKHWLNVPVKKAPVVPRKQPARKVARTYNDEDSTPPGSPTWLATQVTNVPDWSNAMALLAYTEGL